MEVLQIKVEVLTEPYPYAKHQFRVPGDKSLVELATRQGSRTESGWRPIPVLNGDAVRIRAVGTVAFRAGLPVLEYSVHPAGAEPARGVPIDPLERCEKMPHHSLVAFIAGEPMFIGPERTIDSVEQSGQLLLGVNDMGVGNSSGYFDVTVEVNPSDLIRKRQARPAYQPPSWQK